MPYAAVETLQRATLALCEEMPLTSRLALAHAALADIDAERLPEHVRFRFEELRADLAYGADTVSAAIARMSPDDRVRLAERLVRLYGDVVRAVPENDV